MNTKVGVWLDHRKAVIVTLDNSHEKILFVDSDVEKRVRLAGGSRSVIPYGPQDIAAEGRKDRKYLQHLESYFGEVESRLGDPISIYIFGPGEAKIQLQKYLKKNHKLGKHIKRIESADKMTTRQIAARVRGFYSK